MKKQQIISRFFNSKPASSSSPSCADLKNEASNSRAPPPPAKNSSPTVEWPPRTYAKRKNVQDRESLRTGAKRRAVERRTKKGGTEISQFDGNDEDFDSPSIHENGSIAQRKVLKIPGKGEGEGDEGSGGESNRRSRDADAGHVVGSDDDEESGNRKNTPDFACSGKSQGLESAGAYVWIPNPKRGRKGGLSLDEGEVVEIPASDPVKHRKFVEKLIVRADASGEVKESWYGKPPTGKEKYTPLEAQVSELKAKYPDVVLMVEVGYKYRFFGNDAETAAKILGIFAHYDHNFLTASIPTFRLHVHVRRLVEAGCKVGVVRQTETAAIKAHGENKAGPFTRCLSALYTRSTLEAAEDLGGELEGAQSRFSRYLMCIAERPILDSSKNKMRGEANAVRDAEAQRGSYDIELGIVAVETATGDVMFSHFRDTVMRNELEGRLLSFAPVEILLATPLSAQTEKVVKDFAGSEVRVERTSRDFLKDGGALAEVVDFYRTKENNESCSSTDIGEERVDEGLEAVLEMPDIVLQALCLAVRYLKQFGLENVLRLGSTFRPFVSQDEMNLSPNALRQLEILRNNADGTEKGSLLWLLDQTHTAFGARLLRHWITHPLCDHDQIASRLDAVTEIAKWIGSTAQTPGSYSGSGKAVGKSRVAGEDLIGNVLNMVGRMPDLERGITRIFHRTATSKEFVSVMQALVTCAKHLERVPGLESSSLTNEDKTGEECQTVLRSPLLKRLIAAVSSKAICEHANRLLSALNTGSAADGNILYLFNCKDGRYCEILACRAAVKEIEEELDGFLPAFRKLLRKPNLEYRMPQNGPTHLVEAPIAQRVPEDWIKVNSTKNTHRYHPPEVVKALDELALARERLKAASTKEWDIFLEDFSSHYTEFRASVQALAALDCLHSLAVVSRNQGYTRPEFVGQAEPSQLVIKSGRHPILDSTLQERFVPNDTVLHAQHERCQIITGPNMGGKSCYIRQVALIAIMAQVGSYVPASSAKLHVFDAVYTRMGASDSLQKGSSTFLEELSEASTILRNASARSLVIMDELGRGTSTHDGVALAYATLHHLLRETRCLTLFVTHYPKIADLKDEFPGAVNPYYVSYLAEEAAPAAYSEQTLAVSKGVQDSSAEHSQEFTEAAQDITFLYKLVPGVASKSFGLHVARLAQIPESCIINAATMASTLEKQVSDRQSRLENFTDKGVSEKLSGRKAISREPTGGTEDFVQAPSRSEVLDSEQMTEVRSLTAAISSSIGVETPCTAANGQSPMEAVEMRESEDILRKMNSLRPVDDPEVSLMSLKAIQLHLRTILQAF